MVYRGGGGGGRSGEIQDSLAPVWKQDDKEKVRPFSNSPPPPGQAMAIRCQKSVNRSTTTRPRSGQRLISADNGEWAKVVRYQLTESYSYKLPLQEYERIKLVQSYTLFSWIYDNSAGCKVSFHWSFFSFPPTQEAIHQTASEREKKPVFNSNKKGSKLAMSWCQVQRLLAFGIFKFFTLFCEKPGYWFRPVFPINIPGLACVYTEKNVYWVWHFFLVFPFARVSFSLFFCIVKCCEKSEERLLWNISVSCMEEHITLT